MVPPFKDRLKEVNPVYARFDTLKTLQVNLGNLCNQKCAHCHVSASPRGKKVMDWEVMEKTIGFLSRNKGVTLDITGGCPEMNPHFRFFIEATDDLSPRRTVRSNLTIMTEPGMEWLPEFYEQHQLVIVASLPCYLEENVDLQRGKGVYQKSIAALRRLNDLGYGNALELDLVYNPGGDFIPSSQRQLEAAYKEELLLRFGIRFDNLYTITNVPIGRFREYLESKGAYDRYLDLLRASFNPDTAGNIMCRTLVSIDWKGFLYNCDFNQAIGLPITDGNGGILTIEDLEEVAQSNNDLHLTQHCYSCTAGGGSSCTGALSA